MSDKLVLCAGLNDSSRASTERRLGIMKVDPRPCLCCLDIGGSLGPLAGGEGRALVQEVEVTSGLI